MTTEKIEQMESKLDQTPRRLLPQKPLRTGGYTASLGLVELVAILLGLLYLVPFYYVIVNSFKSIAEIYTNTSALPNVWLGSNYTEAWEAMNYGRVFFNSLFITAGANLFIVIFTSMAAWKLVRTKHWISTVIFFLFVAAMVIPFQSIMIPLVKVSSILGLLNSHWGLMIMYLGFGSGISVFLYHGFMKSIPEEIEEAAIIDGCSTWGVFWRIVFPLLKPITVTIVILNSLWIWNDFLLPSLVLRDIELRTIPLATFYFFGQYTKQWDLALAGLVLGIVPLLVFFFGMQKHIIKGITSGSIK
ncbi:MAG: carbohydrate ABC transporter permease [Exiguobacterium sp.]|uniref:Carbohydrate ABC transporter permease n=1 Tax=Exiguobacterium alkaliphilum TaxID=1428684 RepID=A0ABT2KV10_9BACL|nr:MULTISPECIES: carbohydrate ABC transporter permease [Exiguobacterium]MDX5322678.1 carbohydrate ABC transporter permease [Exiguobacterium sp.]KDN57573.1 sugar ABC transporter permease [Exiguobacterium sp. AB2]MCT4794219.1 carbohydrate ABC transporter permease [Exiguobacterium alkaliphilum]MDX5424419.1 carbohydrate ABC transporter permease [Exiguobacterium sp.]MDX6771923.1 carbohydrate ABC transporter permease [Exiguobacterium sp.]